MDVAIAGAGAVGSATALALAKGGHRVVVFEKEPRDVLHQSGRNSGVIHAGYNAIPGTKKAAYCLQGNRDLHAFCQEHHIGLRRGGILVVGQEKDRATIEELHRRGQRNGARTDILAPDEWQDLEPNARGAVALHAPEASSLDAPAFVQALRSAAEQEGATFHFGTRIESWTQDDEGTHIQANKHTHQARVFINAAGLYADQVAKQVCRDMRIIPFRGFYARAQPGRESLVNSHVYAAPDLQFPFLGVHLSRKADGSLWVGPGAMLAFGREAYKFRQANARDLANAASWPGFWKMLARRDIQKLMGQEINKTLRLRAIWKEAQKLVPQLRPQDLVRARAGNRAQMVDRQGNLVSDIVVREVGRTIHVLNAVSPGLTCSLPFGRDLAAQAERLL